MELITEASQNSNTYLVKNKETKHTTIIIFTNLEYNIESIEPKNLVYINAIVGQSGKVHLNIEEGHIQLTGGNKITDIYDVIANLGYYGNIYNAYSAKGIIDKYKVQLFNPHKK